MILNKYRSFYQLLMSLIIHSMIKLGIMVLIKNFFINNAKFFKTDQKITNTLSPKN
jgi:hypothetical protein